MRRLLARLLWICPAVVALGGCARLDSCGLEVLAEAHQERTALTSPYEIDLAAEADAFQAIVPRGSGWKFVNVVVVGPSGVVADDYQGPGAMINQAMVAFPIDSPGVWRFQIWDTQARCSREFTVDVHTPPGALEAPP